jgi:hypothetical protein
MALSFCSMRPATQAPAVSASPPSSASESSPGIPTVDPSSTPTRIARSAFSTDESPE